MTTFAFVNPHWDDYCTEAELAEVFADLIAAGLPFTIEALPDDEPSDDDGSLDLADLSWSDHPSLTAEQRNPSLCR